MSTLNKIKKTEQKSFTSDLETHLNRPFEINGLVLFIFLGLFSAI